MKTTPRERRCGIQRTVSSPGRSSLCVDGTLPSSGSSSRRPGSVVRRPHRRRLFPSSTHRNSLWGRGSSYSRRSSVGESVCRGDYSRLGWVVGDRTLGTKTSTPQSPYRDRPALPGRRKSGRNGTDTGEDGSFLCSGSFLSLGSTHRVRQERGGVHKERTGSQVRPEHQSPDVPEVTLESSPSTVLTRGPDLGGGLWFEW